MKECNLRTENKMAHFLWSSLGQDSWSSVGCLTTHIWASTVATTAEGMPFHSTWRTATGTWPWTHSTCNLAACLFTHSRDSAMSPSIHLCFCPVPVQIPRCHHFSWGGMNKCLFTPDREPVTVKEQFHPSLAWWANECIGLTEGWGWRVGDGSVGDPKQMYCRSPTSG